MAWVCTYRSVYYKTGELGGFRAFYASPAVCGWTMSQLVAAEARDLTARLSDYLRTVADDQRDLQLVGRLSGGWSVETFHLRLGDEDLVLRVAGPSHPVGTNAALEARLMARAREAGVPAPRVVVAEEDPSWLGSPFAIVEFVVGAAPNVWSRRMRAQVASDGGMSLLHQLVELALAIPAVPLEEITPRPSAVAMNAAEYSVLADVDRWLELLQMTSRPRAALTLAGRWLAANAPSTTDVVLQHHDFRLGNVLFDGAGRALAVIDWEFAGAGDPFCDIGYAAQPYSLGRLLRNEPLFTVSPDPTTWVLREYAANAPGGADYGRLQYFVALGIFKMAVALVLPADGWWRGDGGRRDAWLELPILSLTQDLISAIRELP
jgi:aminoglycoside phosphotransferase (APT) family kinase protein